MTQPKTLYFRDKLDIKRRVPQNSNSHHRRIAQRQRVTSIPRFIAWGGKFQTGSSRKEKKRAGEIVVT